MTIVATALLLAFVGICIAYSAFVAYTFALERGRAQERRIWEAILNRAANLASAEGLTPVEAVNEMRRVFSR